MNAGPLPHISTAVMIENARGLAFAAFGKPEGIALLLKCDLRTAQAVQGQALARWHGLMHEVAQAKRVGGVAK